MRYVQTCKAIRIDSKVLKELEKVQNIMEAISDELKELADEDEYFSSIQKDASNASACLWDFLQSYDEEVRGHEEWTQVSN